jgi:putative membrane protein
MSLKYLVATAMVASALIASGTTEAQPAAAPTTNVPSTSATMSSQAFAEKAATTGLYEVQAARIAEQRSRNPAVDRFAEQMIRDHGKNNAELKTVAARVGVRLPARLDAQHAGLIAQLRAANVRDFNSTYAGQQVQGHQDAAALLTSYAQHGDNARLKQFARKTLPVVEHHLEMAEGLPTEPQMARNK